MKKNFKFKNLLFIFTTILLVFILSGCSKKTKQIVENESIKNDNKNIESKVETSKVKMNSELDGVYAFARINNKIVALKENGEEIKIIDDKVASNNGYKYKNIEYSAGKLYLSNYDTIVGEPKSIGVPGFSSRDITISGCMYYVIDLNKGNGNYMPELFYDYVPEKKDHIGVDAPKVYNDIMYFVKDTNEVIAYNVITKEEKTIRKFKNETNFFNFKISNIAEVMIDKENNVLYYTGILEDDSIKLFSYNIETSEEKVLDEGKIFKLYHATKKGIYYEATDYNSLDNNAKYYLYDKEKDEIKTLDNYKFDCYICEPNKYYFEIPEDIDDYTSPIHNLIVEDENGNKKVLIERFNYQTTNNNGVADGIYYYGENEIKIVAEGKQYLINNETLEITPKDKLYEDIVFVNEISNKTHEKEIKYNITKEELIGNWTIDRSNSNVSKYSLSYLYGSSLRLANSLEFKEDNTYTMAIGVGYYENGNYEIKNGVIKLTNINSGDDSPDTKPRESGEFLIREINNNKVIIHKEEIDNELVEVFFIKNN